MGIREGGGGDGGEVRVCGGMVGGLSGGLRGGGEQISDSVHIRRARTY